MNIKKASIIGLGLIGGSLARALKYKAGIKDITGINRSNESLEEALRDGCITRGFHELNEYVFDSDIIFICTPVKASIKYIDDLHKNVSSQCIITDAGSTKAEIVSYVDSMKNPPCFIGGHPMAGSEKMGYLAGNTHLFENAYYILSPGISTPAWAIQEMTSLVNAIGGIPLILDPLEHDRITAQISHVPHIIAAALVNMVRQDNLSDSMKMLAAGGFKDLTRIASSSPEMWENIVSSNSGEILQILDRYLAIMKNLYDHIVCNERDNILTFFKSAQKFRSLFIENRGGLVYPVYEIVVDVEDKPGIIANIATILGNNNINIKNINVSNSREFEQGCLTITLSDNDSLERSFDLLTDNGFVVYKKT